MVLQGGRGVPYYIILALFLSFRILFYSSLIVLLYYVTKLYHYGILSLERVIHIYIYVYTYTIFGILSLERVICIIYIYIHVYLYMHMYIYIYIYI